MGPRGPGAGCERERDLPFRLPLPEVDILPQYSQRDSTSRGAQSRARRIYLAVKYARKTVMALRALARGHTDLDREARGNPPPSLASAAPEVVSRIRDFVYQWLPLAYQVHASVGDSPPRSAGVRRNVDCLTSSYMSKVPSVSSSSAGGLLRRGDLIPAVVADISLPPPNPDRPLVTNISGRIRKAFRVDQGPHAWDEALLRDPPPSEADLQAIMQYEDPRIQEHKLSLLLRLHESGMLQWVGTTRGPGITGFTVVKKITPEGKVVQRIVWDLRRLNLLFVDSPATSFPSPEAFARIEMSSDVVRDSGATSKGAAETGSPAAPLRRPPGRAPFDEVVGFAADIPDCFYTMMVPEDIVSYFWLCGTSDCLAEFISKTGFRPPTPDAALAISSVLMGWSLAPWICQTVVEDVIEDSGAIAFQPRSRIEAGKPVPQFYSDGTIPQTDSLAFVYIDDLGGWMKGGRQQADAALDAVRAALKTGGFGCHKESVASGGDMLETLGFEVGRDSTPRTWQDPDDPRYIMKPTNDRLVDICITTYRIMRHGGSPREVSSVVGSWVWDQLANRPLLSIWQAVYPWIQENWHQCEVRMLLPRNVRCELETAIALAVLCRANLSAPWVPYAYMVDCGPWGAGVLGSPAQKAELRTAAVLSERGGWCHTIQLDSGGLPRKVQHGPVLVGPEWTTPDRWTLLFAWKWHKEEHNTLGEARATTASIQHCVRSGPGCWGHRLLSIGDSQAVIGAVAKGRSSSPGLMYQLRRMAASLLSASMRLYMRYVASADNQADASSRGEWRVGVADETAAKGRKAEGIAETVPRELLSDFGTLRSDELPAVWGSTAWEV